MRSIEFEAHDDRGFTLIELLVVVIVIGILAAVAVPVYLGAQASTKDGGVKNDLGTAKAAALSYWTTNGDGAAKPTFDSDSTTGLKKYGYMKSDDTTATVAFKSGSSPKPTSFCIEGTGVTSNKFHITDSSGALAGGC